jgi:hypothetical protein
MALLLTAVVSVSGPSAAAAGDPCAPFGEAGEAGRVADPTLVEVSGLATSRVHDGVLWAHNDSGADPVVHAMAVDGSDLGASEVEGATALDWEDMASRTTSTGDGELYLADVGDNGANRPSVIVYRVAEPADRPDGSGGRLRVADQTEIRYPDGPADVEAVVVDPRRGDLLLVTKSYLGRSRVLLVPEASLGRPGVVEATDVGGFQVPPQAALGLGLPGTAVTGADVTPDGQVVLVRTYQSVLAFARPPGAALADSFATDPCVAPEVDEPQGEAIAVMAAGDAYVMVSEGDRPPVHLVPIDPAASAEGTPSSTTGTTVAPVDQGASREGSAAWVVVAGAAAVLIGLVAIIRRRRRRGGRRRSERRAAPAPPAPR